VLLRPDQPYHSVNSPETTFPTLHALAFTPFPSMLYVPISIHMGKVSGNGIALGLPALTQLF
jgi:ABC-type uncharacterized transport system permease subunit